VCPGCDAARARASGASLIRDRHRLERSTQVGLARLAHICAPISGKPEIGVCSAPQCNQVYADCANLSACAALRPGHESAKDQPAGAEKWRGGGLPVSGLFFTGSCATAARGADTGIEIRRVPSCFETPRSADELARVCVSLRAARLLSMRASGDDAFWPSEGLTRGCRKRARRSAPCFRPVLYRELYNCSAWRVWHVTRGSIILRKIFFRSGWIAGSSPAMTAEGRLWTRVTPLNALLRSTRARIGFADLQEFTGEPCPEDGSGAVDAPFAPRLIYPSMRTGRALIARAGSPACTAARARAGS